MARYDTGKKYDDGEVYDEVASQPPEKMADISRNWARMNRAERMDLGDSVVVKIGDGGQAVLPTDPDFLDFSAKHTAAKTALAEIREMEDALKAKRAAAGPILDAWRGAMDQLANTGQAKSKGVAGAIVAMGWSTTDDIPAPPQALGQVQNLVVTAGDHDGELDYTHERTVGAITYDRQTTTTPTDAASWVDRETFQRSSGTIGGLLSGSRQWVRVRARGVLGPGPWSDPATKTVP